MRKDLIGLSRTQAFNFDKIRLLQALEGRPVYERTADGVKYTYPSKEERRNIIISIFDNAVDTALSGWLSSYSFESTMRANGYSISDHQVFQDFMHYYTLHKAARDKVEQYHFGDPDKPEKKTEETTHNPG